MEPVIPAASTPIAAPERRVVMLVPGGLDHAGGIGRWAGYMQRSWHAQGLSPSLEVVDTRASGHAGHAAAAFVRALLRIVRLHATGGLGGIHANLSKRGSTARKLIVSALAATLGIRLVIHLHGSGYDAFFAALPAFWQRRVIGMFGRAERVLVLGQGWAEWVIATLGVPAERVQILYNGVAAPARAERQPGACRLLFLGRLGARKGLPELVAALGSPAMAARAWTATLAGDGEVARFRQMVDTAGLAARVDLPGWLGPDATAALLAQADILVLPSHAENSPISIIEALAARVAVVATPVGTSAELLADGLSALLVPVGDAAALTDALVRLIDDGVLRRDIAAAGHAVFARQLEISALARTLAGIHAQQPPC